MKRTILTLTGAVALLGTTLSLRADITFNNLDQAPNFRGFGAAIYSGSVVTTGTNRCQVNSVTLEQLWYDPGNPPQGFQVRIYQAGFQPGNPSPTMTLVADLGNPAVSPDATTMPGYSTFVTYTPASPITLEASTTYAIIVGEAIDGTGSPIVGFTDSGTFTSTAGWELASDLFGLDLGSQMAWSSFSTHLKFKLDASPILNQPPDTSSAAASVATLWSPNGDMVPFTINGVTDPDGDPVTISITAIYQDEPLGNKSPDAVVDGSATASVRATRSGKGNGRVYQVFFTATDGKPDGTVNGVVQITVPHDQAHTTAIDDGPLKGYYNSTGQ